MSQSNIHRKKQAPADWIKEQRKFWDSSININNVSIQKCEDAIQEVSKYLKEFKNGEIKCEDTPCTCVKNAERYYKTTLDRKKMYKKNLKFVIYCCNDDYENMLKSHTNLKEFMDEFLECLMEEEKEGNLLTLAKVCKNIYEKQKSILDQFSVYYN